MIQRIQSFYLLIITGLISSMYFIPLAEIATDESTSSFYIQKVVRGEQSEMLSLHYTSIAITAVIIALAVISLLMYKKRLLQIRLTSLNVLLMLGSMVLLWYNVNSYTEDISGTSSYNIAMIIPAISAVLGYLAIRAIGKDEALVRSMERIR